MNIHYVSTFHVWAFIMYPHFTWITLCLMTIQDCESTEFVVCFAVCAIPSINYRFNFFQPPHCQILNMLHKNAFCSLHTPPPYLMFTILITKTCLYNFDPLKPHFYIVKLGFTGVYIIFVISAQNIDCGCSLEPPRRGGSNEYPQSMFWAEIWKKYQCFFIWKFFSIWMWIFLYIWIGMFS